LNFSADNGLLFFDFSAAPVEIAPGATSNFVCVYNLNGTASPGQTFRLSATSAAAFDIIGKDTMDPATINGPPVQGLTKVVGQGKLLLNALSDLNNTLPAFLPNAPYASAIRFKIDNTPDERVELMSVAVKAEGPADDAAVIAENGVRFLVANSASALPSDMFEFLAEGSINEDNGA